MGVTREQLDKDSIIAREQNDCTVWAVAHACNLNYAEAHAILAQAGRRRGRGFKFRRWIGNNRDVGEYFITPFHSVVVGYRLSYEALRALFPAGRYILGTRGHVFSIVDGQIVDASPMKRAKRLTEVWKVNKH